MTGVLTAGRVIDVLEEAANNTMVLSSVSVLLLQRGKVRVSSDLEISALILKQAVEAEICYRTVVCSVIRLTRRSLQINSTPIQLYEYSYSRELNGSASLSAPDINASAVADGTGWTQACGLEMQFVDLTVRCGDANGSVIYLEVSVDEVTAEVTQVVAGAQSSQASVLSIALQLPAVGAAALGLPNSAMTILSVPQLITPPAPPPIPPSHPPNDSSSLPPPPWLAPLILGAPSLPDVDGNAATLKSGLQGGIIIGIVVPLILVLICCVASTVRVQRTRQPNRRPPAEKAEATYPAVSQMASTPSDLIGIVPGDPNAERESQREPQIVLPPLDVVEITLDSTADNSVMIEMIPEEIDAEDTTPPTSTSGSLGTEHQPRPAAAAAALAALPPGLPPSSAESCEAALHSSSPPATPQLETSKISLAPEELEYGDAFSPRSETPAPAVLPTSASPPLDALVSSCAPSAAHAPPPATDAPSVEPEVTQVSSSEQPTEQPEAAASIVPVEEMPLLSNAKSVSAEVIVPDYALPGVDFQVSLEDGREVTVNCPSDAAPGDLLEIDIPVSDEEVRYDTYQTQEVESALPPTESLHSSSEPANNGMETAEVTVPDECKPGDTFVVESSWGALFEVEVPIGTEAGSILFVELPLPSDEAISFAPIPGIQPPVRSDDSSLAEPSVANADTLSRARRNRESLGV